MIDVLEGFKKKLLKIATDNQIFDQSPWKYL